MLVIERLKGFFYILHVAYDLETSLASFIRSLSFDYKGLPFEMSSSLTSPRLDEQIDNEVLKIFYIWCQRRLESSLVLLVNFAL